MREYPVSIILTDYQRQTLPMLIITNWAIAQHEVNALSEADKESLIDPVLSDVAVLCKDFNDTHAAHLARFFETLAFYPGWERGTSARGAVRLWNGMAALGLEHATRFHKYLSQVSLEKLAAAGRPPLQVTVQPDGVDDVVYCSPSHPQKVPSEERPFTDREMSELYASIDEALRAVKCKDIRQHEDVMGELYTRLRQTLSQRGMVLFTHSHLKMVKYKSRDKWNFIERMVRHMTPDDIVDSQQSLARLSIGLAGLNAAVTAMQGINSCSEKIAKGLEQVHSILNPTDVTAEAELASLVSRRGE